ncbi:MAG: hypothetical protein PHN49_07420 [Candidatus Omnitrophica bacterium]|nr:hypothetical protein [Candidatus Omnitrophota bacterium]MDD5671451.1 hypothetical protein [Candidatus Omnitrophota bacterium]
MREIAISKLIEKSFNRTIMMLFDPFSARRWLALLLIGILSGAFSVGNFGVKNILGKNNTKQERIEAGAQTQNVAATENRQVQRKPNFREVVNGAVQKFFNGKNAVVFILALWLMLMFMIVMVWLEARFKFVWFHAIVNNLTMIVEPFKKYRLEGDSLFQFIIVFTISSFAFFLSLVGFGAYSLVSSGVFYGERSAGIIVQLIGIFGPLIGVIVVSSLLLYLFYLVVDDFVVSIMAIARCRFLQGYQKFVDIYKYNRGEIWLYFLIKFGLGIVAGICQGILGLIGVVISLIAAAVIFGLPYLLAVVMLKIKAIFIFWVFIFIAPFVAGMAVLMTSITLPFAIFFRCFSLYYLSSLNCGYRPIPIEELD